MGSRSTNHAILAGRADRRRGIEIRGLKTAPHQFANCRGPGRHTIIEAPILDNFEFFIVQHQLQFLGSLRRSNGWHLIFPIWVSESEGRQLAPVGYQTPLHRLGAAPLIPRSRNFRRNCYFSKIFDFAYRLDAVARLGSRELCAVEIPATYDAWRPPTPSKNKNEKQLIFTVLKSQFFFVILGGFWRSTRISNIEISFLVIFSS